MSNRPALPCEDDSALDYHVLAGSLFHRGRWSEAIEAYRQALNLDPEFSWAHHGLGDILFQRERWDEAIAAYRQAVQCNAAFYESHERLAEALEKTGELAQAKLEFGRALELQPNEWPIYHKLARLHALDGEWAKAAELYQSSICLAPEFAWSYHNLADAQMHLAQWEPARLNYLQARALDPDNKAVGGKIREVQRLCRQDDELRAYIDATTDSAVKGARDPSAMRILMVSVYPPYPPTTGGALRLFEQLRHLGRRHEVVFVSYAASEPPEAIKASIAKFCSLVLIVKPGGSIAPGDQHLPDRIKRWSTRPMWRVLESLSAVDFDAVLFDFIFTAEFRRLFTNHYTVLEEHNIESSLLRQYSDGHSQIAATDAGGIEIPVSELREEADKLERYETNTWPSFSLRTVVSSLDRAVVENRTGEAETIVVSNGVDTKRMTPLELAASDAILFMGHMAYHPNIDAVSFFAREIFPYILQQHPKAQFLIAGKNPCNGVRKLGELPGVDVIPDPKDMAVVACRCALTAVPLRLGSGTRIKILEAMAMGLPVVSTSIGSEGLDVVDGEHLYIRDHPEAFAQACLRIMRDENARNWLRMNGRLLVKTKYDWEEIFTPYEALLQSRAAEHRARRHR